MLLLVGLFFFSFFVCVCLCVCFGPIRFILHNFPNNKKNGKFRTLNTIYFSSVSNEHLYMSVVYYQFFSFVILLLLLLLLLLFSIFIFALSVALFFFTWGILFFSLSIQFCCVVSNTLSAFFYLIIIICARIQFYGICCEPLCVSSFFLGSGRRTLYVLLLFQVNINSVLRFSFTLPFYLPLILSPFHSLHIILTHSLDFYINLSHLFTRSPSRS